LIELVTELQLAEPTPEALAQLESLLQSPKARRLYIEWVNVQGHLETLHAQRAVEESDQRYSAEEILAVLGQAEDAAPDYYIASQDHSALPPASAGSDDDSSGLTLRQITSAGTYLLRQQVRAHRALLIGIAAVLVLGLTIFLALQGGNTTPATGPTDFVQAPKDHEAPAPTVATLTATHHATWAQHSAEGASAPGSLALGTKLHPNDRLTLTAGFAQITTQHGAVAILEAPCTVELTDNNNALRLIAGKLVGICETESSEGFLVRTPHMDVTDLGTRFGVDASAPDATEVHVYQGEVEVSRSPIAGGDDASVERLVRGEAVRASEDTAGLTRLAADDDRFAAMTPIEIDLPDSGQGLAFSEQDVNWRIVSRQGVALDPAPHPKAGFRSVKADEGNQNVGSSQWLIWYGTEFVEDLQETFLFQTQITVPQSVDLGSASIEIMCAADNKLAAIHVNGQRIRMPSRKSMLMSSYVIDQHLVAGNNTITFEIVNNWSEESKAKSNSMGLRVAWQLHGFAKTLFTRGEPQ